MIQRIQSLYLLLTTLLGSLFLGGTIINFNSKVQGLHLDFSGIGRDAETIEKLPWLSALLILVPVLSFIVIFLYKNRKLQLKMTVMLIFLIVIAILMFGYYVYYITSNYESEIITGIKPLLYLIILILSFLAYRSIKKDDELVKSYDRLR